MRQHVFSKISKHQGLSRFFNSSENRFIGRRCNSLLSLLDQPTVELHQKYHDKTIEYTMNNLDWVQNREFGTDSSLSAEKQIAVRRAARKRFWRWPRLSDCDMHDAPFGPSPQRFCHGMYGDPVENVFVISLPRRPTKLEHVLSELHEEGVSAKIIDAVDGDAILSHEDLEKHGVSALPGYAGHANHKIDLTTGEVGCFMSHYSVWYHMVENDIESALILEDDFDFQPNFAADLARALKDAEAENWNLIYVGRSPVEPDIRRISAHVVEPGYTLWTVGYILRLDAARALVESESYRQFAPLDEYFSLAMGRYTTVYNEFAYEWGRYIPVIFRPLALTPPLVMPFVGSMFLSDTAMMRKRTRFVKDLPKRMTLEEEQAEINSV